jgi:hypothetical protein
MIPLQIAHGVRSGKSNVMDNEFEFNFFTICIYLNHVKNQWIIL